MTFPSASDIKAHVSLQMVNVVNITAACLKTKQWIDPVACTTSEIPRRSYYFWFFRLICWWTKKYITTCRTIRTMFLCLSVMIWQTVYVKIAKNANLFFFLSKVNDCCLAVPQQRDSKFKCASRVWTLCSRCFSISVKRKFFSNMLKEVECLHGFSLRVDLGFVKRFWVWETQHCESYLWLAFVERG